MKVIIFDLGGTLMQYVGMLHYAGCRFVRIDRTGAGNGDIGSLNELLGLLF